MTKSFSDIFNKFIVYIRRHTEKAADLLIVAYLFTLYFITFKFPSVSNIVAALLMGVIWLDVILNKKKIRFNLYIGGFGIFVILCFMTIIVAADKNVAFVACRTMALLWVLSFSLVNYVDSMQKLQRVLIIIMNCGLLLVPFLLLTQGKSIMRLGHELANTNTIGLVFAISTAIALYRLIEKKKWWYLFAFLVLGAATVLTLSRSSVLLIAVFSAVYLIIRLRKKPLTLICVLVGGALAAVALYFILIQVPMFDISIGSNVREVIDLIRGREISDFSIRTRLEFINYGFDMFVKRPILGNGIDNYKVLLPNYHYRSTYSHNNLIELLAGGGVILTAVYYLLHGLVLKKLFKKIKKPSMNHEAIFFVSFLVAFILIGFITIIYYDVKLFVIVYTLAGILPHIMDNNRETKSNKSGSPQVHFNTTFKNNMRNKDKLPNLICPGAMKAGTTTLYAILRQHPDIFIGNIKELHFFDFFYELGIDHYMDMFKDAKNEKYRMDLTPSYMIHDKWVQRISRDLSKDTKFIFMLRNPVDRAYSAHLMHVNKNHETATFENALIMEDERISKNLTDLRCFSYRTRGFYARQIKTFLEYFPIKNIHFTVFEHFIEDIEGECKKIFRFLEIDEKTDLKFNIWANKPGKAKRDWILKLFKIIKRTPLVWLIKMIRKKTKDETAYKFRDWMREKKPSTNYTEKNLETCRILMKEYIDDILALEEIIGKDLSFWIKKYIPEYERTMR